MKKLLYPLLILLLLLTAVFFWRGGHHMLFLASAAGEWLDSDTSDQTIRVQTDGLTFSADTFWTEYNDQLLLGLESGEYCAYFHEGIVILDNGKSYALSLPRFDRKQVLQLALGRVTKSGDLYTYTIETDTLSIRADIRAGETIETIHAEVQCTPEGRAISFSADVVVNPEESHTLPQPVRDAIVLAQMEPPLPLQELLDALQPVLQHLDDTEADVSFSAECGILEVHESGVLRRENGALVLQCGDREIPLDMLGDVSRLTPEAAALMLLRNTEFSKTETGATFCLILPPEDVYEFCQTLVPQFVELPITLKEAQVILQISGENLDRITFTTGGSVPLILANIPITLTAEFIPR